MRTTRQPQTVDEYIAGFPTDVQKILRRVRATVRKAAPSATETISYGIPAYAMNGRLVYFAGFKTHIGMYPITKAIRETFKKELPAFQSPKAQATLRFPMDRPIPYDFIKRVVEVRIKENLAPTRSKKSAR